MVLVWLTLETVNIGTLWESGTLDMDILHCTVCIRRHHAVLTSLLIPGTEVRRGNLEGREKIVENIIENICSSRAEHSVVMVVNWLKC